MKKFNIQYNVGLIKYLVNVCDGIKTNKDGSPFISVVCFKSKSKMKKYILDLTKKDYIFSTVI